MSGATRRVMSRAPGRVTIIGEHTDYNGGRALTMTIGLGVTVMAEPSQGDVIAVHAQGEEDRITLDRPQGATGWRAYARGAVAELRARGVHLVPSDAVVTSDLPMGAGLASSAAFSIALCDALLHVAGAPRIELVELARIGSAVERRWAGADTGLLDQIAILSGDEHTAVAIDFRTLSIQQVALQPNGWTFATLDSGQRRDLAASRYNERRAECRAACRLLHVESLSQATADAIGELPSPLDRRARHVLAENERVDAATGALRNGDMATIARLLNDSHASLRDQYEVSTDAVEATVARARAAGAAGARIIGGGFGGHVLALFPPGVRVPAEALPVRPGPGAHVTGA